MREHDCQIDIPMKEFIISMDGVPCSGCPEGPVPIKVRLVDHQVVPSRSQVLVWARPDRIYPGLGIVGPIPVFEERYSLKVASFEDSKNKGCRTANQDEKIFAVISEDLGRTDLDKHAIDTGNAPPIKQRPCRT